MDKSRVLPILALIIVIAGSFAIISFRSQNSEACGIQECHGLEITCGSDVPQVCTEIYKLGDFCRQYAGCRVVDGDCVLVTSEEFSTCKECVAKCISMPDGDPAFLCEDQCRAQF